MRKNSTNCIEKNSVQSLTIMFCIILLVGATEECQVVLVDVLGDVEAIGLDQLLIICQLILNKREDLIQSNISTNITYRVHVQ